ncbi:glycosyltransferase [Catenuloplanes atrovinosus]|uniref:Chloroorienticin B synthase/vancomycin aglycone glucosyltransferase n=1 Tax=Catenuloplanes atrovinosus TaxID=137266 RepID=A0AAE4CAE6_9ACTN|nr:glycosyltransferase [Catenuloplanes atrovinosus]MDR7276973.1 chloroorienticin B synthase/vancomycin aglycone glucosyltransferase [Catenuloplanes atrovinosus]
MRVLFWSRGPRGDVEPLVALAARLRALGADARMCAPSNFAERLAETGVPLVLADRSMLDGPREAGRGPEPELVAARLAERFDTVPAVAEGCDAIVASGLPSGAAAVRSVAEKLGIRYFYAIASPYLLPTPEQRESYNRGADRMFGGPLNERRASIGLPPVRNVYDYYCTDRPWLAADPVLAPPRPGAGAAPTGAWMLPDERPLAPALEAFLRAGPPPVYLGFGSGPAPAEVTRVAVAAVRARGGRLIISRGWAGLTQPGDGDDCLAIGEVNLRALFGRVAVAVHHGGTGTTHVATLAGVPQIVVPQIADQPRYAERVAELGIGVAHPGPVPTVESLSGALDAVAAPEVRARAAAVAGTVRTDGTDVAARRLCEAIGRNAPEMVA